MPDLHERVASVETLVAGMSKTLGQIAVDVRMTRDYVVAERARRAAAWRTTSRVGGALVGVVTFASGLYVMFGSALAKIFG